LGVHPLRRATVERTIFAALALSATLASAASAAASHPGPLALLNGTSAGGIPAQAGGGPSGQNVRFIDHGTFWIAVLVRNSSSIPITLVRASTPEPPNSLVRETRAGFSSYKPCTGDNPCPWPNTPTSTKPLTLRPHAEAAVKFNYQLVSCAAAKAASTASGTALVLVYRYGNGPRVQESVPLGGAQLRLLRPVGVECLPRPYSYIGLVGSFTTSPEHKPIPGSAGDMCTKTTTGGLAYTSREFMDRSGTTFQIEISLPHYLGIGTYQRTEKSLGSAKVAAVGFFGTPGPTTIFHDPNATVTVTTAHGTTLGGRLTAVFSGHRRFFRAYGNWRCTTRR
jgi:hypothetical protein